MPDGSRICWNFNIKNKGCKFAKPGAKCKRGSHSCMKCFKDHPQFQCSDKWETCGSLVDDGKPNSVATTPINNGARNAASEHPGKRCKPAYSISHLRQRLMTCKRKFSESACASVVQEDSPSSFDSLMKKRVDGKFLSSLMVIEVFSGTAGLCAEVRRHGLLSSVGVDARVAKRNKSPVLRIHLGEKDGKELLWRILQQDNIAGIYMGPPCGTSSRAREIRRASGPDPRPLRTDNKPDGLDNLQGQDKKRVLMANRLYALTAKILLRATEMGIPVTIESPARSLFWKTSNIAPLLLLRSSHAIRRCFCQILLTLSCYKGIVTTAMLTGPGVEFATNVLHHWKSSIHKVCAFSGPTFLYQCTSNAYSWSDFFTWFLYLTLIFFLRNRHVQFLQRNHGAKLCLLLFPSLNLLMFYQVQSKICGALVCLDPGHAHSQLQ